MANEETLWAAIVAILEGDSGAGGVRTLIGKAHPLVAWGDPGMNTLPIVVGSRRPSRLLSPSESSLLAPFTFDVFTTWGAGDLAIRVRDRIETILTSPALKARNVDAAVFHRERRSLPELEQGGQREALDIDFLITR